MLRSGRSQRHGSAVHKITGGSNMQETHKASAGAARRVLALLTVGIATATVGSQVAAQDDSRQLLSVDHYVQQVSKVPAIEGELTQIYVRERVLAGAALRSSSFNDKVVLFVHGAGTPAEVAFDVPYEDYSWMAYLAQAGFDVFAMDMSGYGRSTRPAPMNDPCNLSPEQRPGLAADAAGCKPSYPGALTTIASDWSDIDRVVDYLRELRGVERVSLVGWSLGGPRAGGYAAQYPDKIARVALLSPAYDRNRSGAAPERLPVPGAAITKQTHADFVAGWQRQIGCASQYNPNVAASVWSEMMAADPVGATWGPGIRRAPQTTVWGWNQAVVGRSRTPMLLVAPIHDKQVVPERVRELYEDLGANDKVLLDLGCASHNAMWEGVHASMFEATLEWLRDGTVNGMARGIVRMGYED
jgi:pimeloyl-ACP methyl ester carboxylesterase